MTCIVIPARLNSTRLPKKMLLSETGKPLIQHTWESCISAEIGEVYIATDNQDIQKIARNFGAMVVHTPECRCGSERVYEASKHIPKEAIINVQGDTPEVTKDVLTSVKNALNTHNFVSVCYPDKNNNSSAVKVLIDCNDNLRWTSRYLYYHVGIYGFGVGSLDHFVCIKNTANGKKENLEQIRIIENNNLMHMVIIDEPIHSIDTREDYDLFILRHHRL